MGWLTDLFGGKKDVKPITTQSAQTQDVAPWQMPFWDQLIAQARTVGDTQGGAPGDYVADFTPDTLAAWERLRAMEGGFQPGIDSARMMAEAGGGGFDPEEFARYQSGATGGVLDEIARRGSRNFMEDVLPDIQDRFIASGQPGSTRERDITAQMGGRANEAVLGEQRLALEAANQRAMQGYLTGQGQRLTGATTRSGIESQAQTLGQREAAARLGIGTQQEGREQAGMDIARDYPFRVMGALSSAGGTLPRVGTTTGTKVESGRQEKTGGIIPKVLGLAAGAAGTYFGGPLGGMAASGLANSAFGGNDALGDDGSGNLRSEKWYARGGRARAHPSVLEMMRRYADGGRARHPSALDVMRYYADGGRAKIARTMREFRDGELHSGSRTGPMVRDRRQALAIAMAQSRRAA